MFEIQEDHVRNILIVVSGINHLLDPCLLVDASMTNVPNLVKTIMTACMKIAVGDCGIVFPKQVSAKGFVAPIDPIAYTFITANLVSL